MLLNGMTTGKLDEPNFRKLKEECIVSLPRNGLYISYKKCE